MQPVIHLQPVEAWAYHKEERKRLEEELVEIATNEETKTSVYITDECGFPDLFVYRDDKKIFQSQCLTQYETERNLRVVYAQYLVPLRLVTGGQEEAVDKTTDDDADLPPGDELDAMSESEFKEYCDDRENVILAAVCNLIDVLTEDETDSIEFGDEEEDENIDTIVNKIVEYLAIKCGFRIRRPMEIMDDDTGLIVRTEYPYEDFEFGDGELSV